MALNFARSAAAPKEAPPKIGPVSITKAESKQVDTLVASSAKVEGNEGKPISRAEVVRRLFQAGLKEATS